MMKKISKYLAILFLALSFSNCEDNIDTSDLKYVTFENTSIDIGVDEGSETTKDIFVYTSNTTNSDRVFDLAIVEGKTTLDAAAYTVPSTVTIPAGTNEGIITVTIKDVNLSLLDKTVQLRLIQSEKAFIGDNLTINGSLNCPGTDNKLKITLDFDNYPEEAAWKLVNSNGETVMASSDPLAFGAYAGFKGSTTIPECLPSGDYTFVVYDVYKDGGTTYTITVNGEPLYSIDGGDYEFTNSATISF